MAGHTQLVSPYATLALTASVPCPSPPSDAARAFSPTLLPAPTTLFSSGWKLLPVAAGKAGRPPGAHPGTGFLHGAFELRPTPKYYTF
ncbi:MAG: hypothetical protein K0S16_1609, partial [Moraxellaceae bacterium]|nr:hypothetical protein [Moraxellaceae bacterium]